MIIIHKGQVQLPADTFAQLHFLQLLLTMPLLIIRHLRQGGGFGKRTNFGFFPGAHEGWLYCAVLPYQIDNSGFRLFKTADGINWIKVTDDGFGDNWGTPRAFASVGGKLYM